MKFIYGKTDWSSMERRQENCYLLTNGLGGFSSLTMVGSSARNDHALLMASIKAPNSRYNMILNLGEILYVDNKEYDLSTQEFIDSEKNRRGYEYQSMFSFEDLPHWIYNAGGVQIEKTIAMKQNENTIAVVYRINNCSDSSIRFEATPYMEFVPKGHTLSRGQAFITDENSIKSNDMFLNYKTDGKIEFYDTEYEEDLYFSHDERDGRESRGCAAHNHRICFNVPSKENMEFYIIYSMNEIKESAENIIKEASIYRKNLAEKCSLKSRVGKTLAKSADMFVVNRESTNGKSIIAGYPFFEDWGRDTMISLAGCCIYTGQFENAKSIFRTFMHYCRNGLMPNLFPEGSNRALYNTADASLLFINTLYEYYKITKDIDFIKEVYPVMEEIIYWYRKGTDFGIFMDEDGLICAGKDFDQVTWMDVRVDDVLPTPRHGKPVEINAYWYSSLRIMDELALIIGYSTKDYRELSEKVKESFNLKFWNEERKCLKDVISLGKDKHDRSKNKNHDNQIRCNQIWALSMNFTMLDREKELQVLDTVFQKLYTPYGLRTLEMDDEEFKGFYGGSQFERDMAYHQGTVWVFPLGAYYASYLRIHDYTDKAVEMVKSQLQVMEAALREGCAGQLPEIYDGKNPSISKGCFAQAWSVAEILKVYYLLESKGGAV
ncbi:amylo-alpha-1,6-glucosidase [uncultured Clostridium sp.]|uniref:amylo-alpha-1,6-glucosidase n=1 Tax=uncultured Clostridium sp. TaxID=59620 RepID=UPI0025DDCCF7|nr:amylo-alpha-1,6-glucosidase [uncultured Clostridium sp.]